MRWIFWGQWACQRCWSSNPPESDICMHCGHGKH